MSNNVQTVTAVQDCLRHVLFEPGEPGLRKSLLIEALTGGVLVGFGLKLAFARLEITRVR